MQLLKSDMKDADDSHDIERWQQFPIGQGFNPGRADGDFGQNSLKAAHDFEQASIDLANQHGSFDGRNESNIQTLLPAAQ